MSITSAMAIYFVLWWVVLFAILSFGVRSQHEAGDAVAGTDLGAPLRHNLGFKFLMTTIVATILFSIGYAAYSRGYLNIERLSKLVGVPF